MNRSRIKSSVLLFTGALAGALFFGMSQIDAEATGLSGMLPTAGFSESVEGGTSIKTVKEEVKEIVKKRKASNGSANATTSATPSEDAADSATSSTEATSEGTSETSQDETVVVPEIIPIEEEDGISSIDFDKEIVEPVIHEEKEQPVEKNRNPSCRFQRIVGRCIHRQYQIAS